MTGMLPAKSPTVHFRQMDDGGVLFCSRTEVYFGLNVVGSRIWEALPDEARSEMADFDNLILSLREAYPGVDPETLVNDVREFLEAMASNELVNYEIPRPP